MWWLPQFVRNLSLTVSDDAMVGPHGKVTNVQELAVILKRVERIIRENYEGTYANVSQVFRESTREEKLKGMTQGDTESAATLCSSSALKPEGSLPGSPTHVGGGAKTGAVGVGFNLALG